MLKASRWTPCPVDGTPVDSLPERQGRPAKYCSAACRQRAFRARRREERAAVAAAEAITREAAAVPAELRARARWVRWTITRDGRKLPLQARTKIGRASCRERV